MAIIDLPTDIHENPLRHSLQGLIEECAQSILRKLMRSPQAVSEMDEVTQQSIVDQLNPYAAFELSQRPELTGVPLTIVGEGVLFVCDLTGTILGAEVISNGDVVTGELAEVCVLPVPTMDAVYDHTQADAEIPMDSQVLSPVLLLNKAVYKTGMNSDDDFDVEHDLGVYQVGIASEHRLHIDVTVKA